MCYSLLIFILIYLVLISRVALSILAMALSRASTLYFVDEFLKQGLSFYMLVLTVSKNYGL